MAKKESLIVSGIHFPPGVSAFLAQLWLFRYSPLLQLNPTECPMENPKNWNPESAYCGTGRYEHCRILIEALLPSFQWHTFSERLIKAFCEHSKCAVAGSGGSGKSTATAAYSMIWGLCGMHDKQTSVRIASTTISAAMGRIWKNISEYFSEMNRTAGRIENLAIYGKPIPEIRASATDFAHGWFVTPVAQGDVQKAIDRLKGRHTDRILLIGDETDAISQAVPDVSDNLRIGCTEFQEIWLGNLPSMFNPLGRIMEPAPDTPVTEACGTEWTSTTGVHCIRLDGEESPNVIDGTDKWKGIIRKKDIDDILRRNKGVKGQQYWIMVKGLPPPEGVDDTVLSEATLNRFHTRDPVTWATGYTVSASLDPGFGGDPCVLRFYHRGLDAQNRFLILCADVITIPIESDAANPAEYQISEKTIEACKSRSVDPTEFIIGSTGIGRGVAAVLQRSWSASIELCEEGGATTTRPVSNEDSRPSRDVYDRLVTELWFSIREFVQADMIRGMDLPTSRQLCSRRWEYKGSGAGKRVSLEKKSDMKSRGIASPGDGDCLGFYLELLRRKGINASPQGQTAISSTALSDEADSYDFDSRDDCYSDSFQ